MKHSMRQRDYTFMHRRMFLSGISGTVLLSFLAPASLAIKARAARAKAPVKEVREVRFDHSTVRLLDGGWMGEDARLAGIEIDLKKGWKTYWKVPGDSGLPPSFDFSGSTNVKDIKVLWPTPKRYKDPELGETIGYKDHVIFPVRIVPADPEKPVTLSVQLSYALCSDICIPAQAQLVRQLLPEPDSDDAPFARVRVAYSKVPTANPDVGPEVVKAYIRRGKTRPELVLVLKGVGLGSNSDIFVEGPDIVSFCHPRFLGREGMIVRYFLPVDGIDDPAALAGAKLRLTIVGENGAWERTVILPRH